MSPNLSPRVTVAAPGSLIVKIEAKTSAVAMATFVAKAEPTLDLSTNGTSVGQTFSHQYVLGQTRGIQARKVTVTLEVRRTNVASSGDAASIHVEARGLSQSAKPGGIGPSTSLHTKIQWR